MHYQSILKNIKDKQYKPVYILHGQENYFIDLITNTLEDTVLNETEKGFNLSVYYGRDAKLDQLLSTAASYPAMSDYRVVVLKEAQDFKQAEGLAPYFEAPTTSTIFVFAHKNKPLDKRKKWVKTLSQTKHIEFFEAKQLPENELINWMINYTAKKNIRLQQEAAIVIKELLGFELTKITNELDKICINLPGNAEINLEQLKKAVSDSREYSAFEFSDAIMQRQIKRVNTIIRSYSYNPNKHPIQLIIGLLYANFSKLLSAHAQKINNERDLRSKVRVYNARQFLQAMQIYSYPKTIEIMHMLSAYDLRSKGIENASVSSSELLRELAYRIMH